MKKVKQIATFFILQTVVCYNCVYAQQWSGPNNTSSSISRTGPIQSGSMTINVGSFPVFSFVRTTSVFNDQEVGRFAIKGGDGRFGSLIIFRANGNWGSNLNQAGTDIEFWTQDQSNTTPSSPRMTINRDGKVGIGTTTPSVKLDVVGAGGSAVELQTNGRIRSNSGAGGLWLSNVSDGFVGNRGATIGFWTNGPGVGWNALSIVKSNGNVGIGTFSPQSRLHVAGDTRVDGIMGIGTSMANVPAGYQLGVDGKVICEELKVKNSNVWPDYVFNSSYDLMSLDDVGKYIEQNKHLPNIPSAEEVEKNGIEVGDMNARLLQKIEELTLYLLELKQENEGLKNRVVKLENK